MTFKADEIKAHIRQQTNKVHRLRERIHATTKQATKKSESFTRISDFVVKRKRQSV